jgi:hypothetical protein
MVVGILPLPLSLNFKLLGRLKKHKVLKLNDKHQLPVCTDDLVAKNVKYHKEQRTVVFWVHIHKYHVEQRTVVLVVTACSLVSETPISEEHAASIFTREVITKTLGMG